MPRSESRRRRHMIGIRVTTAELEQARQKAAAEGVSVARLVREAVLGPDSLTPRDMHTGHPPALDGANEDRARDAGARNAAKAKHALDALGTRCPVQFRIVAEARIAHPEASWAQIGAGLGMGKNAAAGYFRRLLKMAGVS